MRATVTTLGILVAACGRVDFGAARDSATSSDAERTDVAGTDVTRDAATATITLEPGFPVFVDIDDNAGSDATTPMFSTLGPDRLLVTVYVWGTGGTDEEPLDIATMGVAWTQQVLSTFPAGSVPPGTSGNAIWTAWASSPITDATVSASRGTDAEHAVMTVGVYAFVGASPTIAMTASYGNQTGDQPLALAIDAPSAGDVIVAGFHAGEADMALSPLASTVFDDTDNYAAAPYGHFQAIGRAATATTAAGSVTLGSPYVGPFTIISAIAIAPAE